MQNLKTAETEYLFTWLDKNMKNTSRKIEAETLPKPKRSIVVEFKPDLSWFQFRIFSFGILELTFDMRFLQ